MQICSGATTIADDADGGACYMTGGGAVERWSGAACVCRRGGLRQREKKLGHRDNKSIFTINSCVPWRQTMSMPDCTVGP